MLDESIWEKKQPYPQFPGPPYFPQMDFDRPHIRRRGRRASFKKVRNARAVASSVSSPAAHRPGAWGVTSNSRSQRVALDDLGAPFQLWSVLLPSCVSPALHLPLTSALSRQSPLTWKAQLSSSWAPVLFKRSTGHDGHLYLLTDFSLSSTQRLKGPSVAC